MVNVDADGELGMFNNKREWMLDPGVFQEVAYILGRSTIDMFASRLNTQCEMFVSWRPDTHAYVIDAFTLDWTHDLLYCFSPF